MLAKPLSKASIVNHEVIWLLLAPKDVAAWKMMTAALPQDTINIVNEAVKWEGLSQLGLESFVYIGMCTAVMSLFGKILTRLI